MNLSSGLAPHKKQIIETLMCMPDWVSQDEFDDAAKSFTREAVFTGPETYVLHRSNPQLHLLQIMIAEELAERKRESGRMWYRAKRGASS